MTNLVAFEWPLLKVIKIKKTLKKGKVHLVILKYGGGRSQERSLSRASNSKVRWPTRVLGAKRALTESIDCDSYKNILETHPPQATTMTHTLLGPGRRRSRQRDPYTVPNLNW